MENTFKTGDLVWVRHEEMMWMVKHYSHEKEGMHYCFLQQNKTGDSFYWKQIRKFSDNPLI